MHFSLLINQVKLFDSFSNFISIIFECINAILLTFKPIYIAPNVLQAFSWNAFDEPFFFLAVTTNGACLDFICWLALAGTAL